MMEFKMDEPIPSFYGLVGKSQGMRNSSIIKASLVVFLVFRYIRVKKFLKNYRYSFFGSVAMLSFPQASAVLFGNLGNGKPLR